MPADRDLFNEEEQMVAMSFGDHLEELRIRLILSIVGLAVGMVITLIPPLNLGRLVMEGMTKPADRALGGFEARRRVEESAAAMTAKSFTPVVVRIGSDDLLRALKEAAPSLDLPASTEPSEADADSFVELSMKMRDAEVINLVGRGAVQKKGIIALTPMETPLIFFTVCMIAGLVISSPWVFYQIWAFIAAGLYRHERSYVYKFLPFSLGLFLIGVFLAYFGVLPLTLRFIMQFNLWMNVEPNLTLSSWMGFATILPLVFGIGFQTPLVMMFLARLGILSAADFRAKRKFAILLTVIAAALLTPGPDVVSQIMLAAPMLLLYELGIILVARAEKQAIADVA